MSSQPTRPQRWCHLPLRLAPEVVNALVEEAERRYLSPSRLVEQLLREELPRLATQRVIDNLRAVRGAPSSLAPRPDESEDHRDE